jgi:hypothetical protein
VNFGYIIGSVEIGGTERGGCQLRAGKEPFGATVLHMDRWNLESNWCAQAGVEFDYPVFLSQCVRSTRSKLGVTAGLVRFFFFAGTLMRLIFFLL